eukprot:359928-Chlamydomonas_euryale.AAC.1
MWRYGAPPRAASTSAASLRRTGTRCVCSLLRMLFRPVWQLIAAVARCLHGRTSLAASPSERRQQYFAGRRGRCRAGPVLPSELCLAKGSQGSGSTTELTTYDADCSVHTLPSLSVDEATWQALRA